MITRETHFAAYSATGTLLRIFDNQPAAERWMDSQEMFPGDTVSHVTITTEREPIKRRRLKLASSR